MKVILTQEVKGRGAEGDVVDVARGFANNYLFPRSMAIPATSGNLKQLEQRMHNIRKRDEERISGASSLSEALDGKSVTISAKVGEEGKLFGSVTSVMVEEAIREQLGQEVDRKRIETHGHIKEVGEHPVDVTIYRDIKATVTVNVVAEGAPIPTTEVVEVEGVAADDEAFVHVVAESAEQAEAELALEEAVSDEVEIAEDETTEGESAE
ncbi:MAG: 50S ribosomal protein L9 [Coriobacteriales bacterium]|nr:50S ribosomal protein L9 [Coriobacteriales bacterium]